MKKSFIKRFYLCVVFAVLVASVLVMSCAVLECGTNGEKYNCCLKQFKDGSSVEANVKKCEFKAGKIVSQGVSGVHEGIANGVETKTEVEGEVGEVVSISEFGDLILYEYLMFVRDGKYPTEQELTDNPLKVNDFSSCTELNVSDVRDGDYRITDVSGLGLFNFSALKNLDLSKNALTSIQAKTFAGIQSLETLNLNGNNLTTLEFGTLQSVNTLLADSNQLTKVDLSILASGGRAMLRYNKISDIRELQLKPNGFGASVDVYGNKINNFIDGVYQNYNFVIGFQYEYDAYNEKNAVKIVKFSGQDYYLECVNVQTLSSVRIDDSACLVPATYQIRMRSDTVELDYKTLTLKVEKSAPTITIFDKDGEQLELTDKITEEITIVFNSNDERYSVLYSINGAGFVSGNSVTLSKSGTYSFSVYAVSDAGDNSQISAFTIKLSINNSNLLQMLGIMISIFVFAGVVYGVLVFLNIKARR